MTLLTFGGRFAKKPKPGEPPTPLQLGNWLEVFQTQHLFDAHAWPYVRYIDGEVAPAIRAGVKNGKPENEGMFLCSLVFLDYDESTEYSAILNKISDIPEDHWLSKWAVLYPTRGGMRIVYRLEDPVLPEEYGPLVRGISIELFKHTQLRVDSTTDQWHRCFRLPSVTRADEKAQGPTWKEKYYFEPIITDNCLDPDKLPSVLDPLPWGKKAATALASDHKPDIDNAVSPSKLKIYKKYLRNSRFKEYIFDNLEIPQGRRDQMLLGMATDVIAKCYYRVPECSAEEVFSLLCPIALSFVQDGESWTDKLWRMVQHCWNGEVKKEQERAEKQSVDRDARETLIESMLEKMPRELVPNDPIERDMFARRHFCLQTKAGAFVITEDGDYTTEMLRSSQLPAYFNSEVSFLDQNRFRNPQGKLLTGSEILNEFSTVIHDARYVPDNKSYAELRLHGDRKVLEVSPFSLRADLVEKAEFDKDVEEWLSKFNNAKKLKLWLASALALNRGPTAALFLKGPARVGKSMLAMGLAECFGTRPASAMQAFNNFNGTLAQTPVILIDEGLPQRREGLDTADLFRSLVTGSGVSTQQKFMDQLSSVIPYRIIMAANSYDMVTDLIGRRSLGTEDMDAFRERILVVEPGPGPSNFLDTKGNMAFTADDPKGSWIGGECRLARHLIRLYQLHFEENEFVRDGKRMLVEGHQHPAFTLAFDLSGMGREVVESLAKAIEAFVNRRGIPGMTKALEIDQGVVWIRKWPFCTSSTSGNPANFARALERFCTNATRRSVMDMSTSYKVDLTKVIVCADALGLSTKGMRDLENQAIGIA